VLETPKGVGELWVNQQDSHSGLILGLSLGMFMEPIFDSRGRLFLVS
jgi:hypothetical protein